MTPKQVHPATHKHYTLTQTFHLDMGARNVNGDTHMLHVHISTTTEPSSPDWKNGESPQGPAVT